MGSDYVRKKELSFPGHLCFLKSLKFLAEDKGKENSYPANPDPTLITSPSGTRTRQDKQHCLWAPASFPYLSGQSGVSQVPSGTEYSCFYL